MNELALFAGAGGGILGGHLLGWRTVCAVEWEPYAASVLAARQNDGVLPPFPIWDDVQSFDGRPWRGSVDVVSGGFPCQDISVAGKGAGIDGARSGMWGHMARIVGEVRPRFVFVENSPALVTRGLGRVLGDLAALGYDCRWTVLGAADVGALHTSGTGSGCEPNGLTFFHTPNTNGLDGGSNSRRALARRVAGSLPDLDATPLMSATAHDAKATAPAMWPTPTAHNAKEGGFPSEHERNTPTLAAQAGGSLNPTWVEWLMGWPLGWTDLKPLETGRFPSAPQQLGGC
jgi:hypothetical protein